METRSRLAIWLHEASGPETAELIGALRDAGVEGPVRPRMGDPLPGIRGAEANMADVVANVSPAVGALERIIAALRGWLARRPRRKLKITIGDATVELTGFSTASEEQLVKAFIHHVSQGG